MNYSKLKKDDLILMCVEKDAELANLVHLKDAVESKDNEISSIKASYEKKLDALKEKHLNYDEVLNEKVSAKNKFDNETREINNTLLQKDRYIKELEDFNARRAKEINKIMFNYGALMKTMQGTLDTHIELNNYLTEEVNNPGGI